MTAREGVVADQLTLMLLSLLIRVLPALAVASALLGERAQHEHENPLYNNTERKHDVQKIKEHAEDLFMRLMNEQHGSSPAGSSDYLERKRRFLESVRRQKHLNARARSSGANDTAFYGINQFSDLSPQEFRAIFLRSFTSDNIPVFPVNVYNNAKPAPLPKRFDWRDMNAVTPVKDQQSCGSCWAFSVVEAIESAYAIQSHSLEELSVQQVIDCSEKNLGCNGGSPTTALRWLNQTKVKLVRNSEYNYKAMTGMCHYFAPTDFGVSVKGFEAYNFRGYEEEMMSKLVELGPLVVLVDAISWQDYLGGIIQHHCSSGESNHAVLITGFDKSGDVPYWIVRNSWSASWGINGYAYVKIGGNVCALISKRSKRDRNTCHCKGHRYNRTLVEQTVRSLNLGFSFYLNYSDVVLTWLNHSPM